VNRRRTKRGWPKINGLEHFEEIRVPPQRGYRATCYKSKDIAITAMGITPEEAREQVTSLFQMNAGASSEMVPIAVSFGQVSGWKCRPWGRLCYILFPGDDGVLIHIDPIKSGGIDEVAIESHLHTLTVA
jgi:hypothetical protein